MRLTSDLKNELKALLRRVRRVLFLKGSGGQEEQVLVPILLDEQDGQLHRKMLVRYNGD